MQPHENHRTRNIQFISPLHTLPLIVLFKKQPSVHKISYIHYTFSQNLLDATPPLSSMSKLTSLINNADNGRSIRSFRHAIGMSVFYSKSYWRKGSQLNDHRNSHKNEIWNPFHSNDSTNSWTWSPILNISYLRCVQNVQNLLNDRRRRCFIFLLTPEIWTAVSMQLKKCKNVVQTYKISMSLNLE